MDTPDAKRSSRPKSVKRKRKEGDAPQLAVSAAPVDVSSVDSAELFRILIDNQAKLFALLTKLSGAMSEQRILTQKAIIKSFNYESKSWLTLYS